MNLDRALLEIERIAGSGSVIRDPDIRAAYSHDESEVEPHLADAIVRVERGDVLALVVEIAAKYEIPLTARGAGTGRVGGAVPVHGGIVLSTEKLNSIVEIDAQEGIAIVDPGVVLADLHAAVEAEGLFYPPDPNSLATCTIGGNLACNAGGPRAFKYGVTRNYVLSLQAVTGSGARLNVGRPTVKGVTGYDLAGLIVGSEGTSPSSSVRASVSFLAPKASTPFSSSCQAMRASARPSKRHLGEASRQDASNSSIRSRSD